MDSTFLSEQDRDVLRQSVLCGAMSEEELSGLLASGMVKTLDRLDYLFLQGDPAVDLYLILEGSAQIARDGKDGSHTLIAVFEKGDSLAEVAALVGKPYPASAQAMTKLRVLCIRAALVLDVMQSNRNTLARTLAALHYKLHVLVDEVEVLKTTTIRERLAGFLLDLVTVKEGTTEITLPYSKSMIAAKLGTSPQQLSRIFNELKKHGVINKGQRIQIDDIARLRDVAARP